MLGFFFLSTGVRILEKRLPPDDLVLAKAFMSELALSLEE